MKTRNWIIVIGFCVAIDQLSKWWVETNLPLQVPIPLLPFLSLFRTYNEGVAFSALSGLGPWPLILLTIAIMAFVIWLWRNLEQERRTTEAGYALVLAGALGNLIDRVQLGKVVDMIFFHIDQIGFQFAIFNLADTFITLGAMAIIFDEIMLWRAGRNSGTQGERQ